MDKNKNKFSLLYLSVTTKTLLLSALVIFLLQNCANPGGLTGGKKDSLPPRLLASVPANKSINFTKKEIMLQFDEWVKLENLQKELIITPTPKSLYKSSENKTSISIIFEKDLEPNTTYTFNFRKAIKDITEGNIAKNAKITFSTGSKIDSLYVRGQVQDVISGKVPAKAIIALYQEDDTLKVEKDIPYYITQMEDNGSFNFENIRKGKYKIFALSDENNNNFYNAEKEKIGFLTSSINLTQNKDSVELFLGREDHILPKIMRKRASNTENSFILELSEGLKTLDIESANAGANTTDNDKIAYILSSNGKEIKFFNTQKYYDSIPLRVVAQDSAGNSMKENVKIIFSKKSNKNAPFTLKITPSDGQSVQNDFSLEFNFSKPVKDFNEKALSYLKNKDTVNISPLIEKNADFEWNKQKTQLKIKRKIIFQNINIKIDSNAFVSVENETLKTQNLRLAIKDPLKFGSLKLTLKPKATRTDSKTSSYILQLLSETNQVIREEINPKNIKLEYLERGKYRLRVILDSNKNGRWDGGDYLKGTPHEQIIYFNKEISIRENWDVEEVFEF